MITMTSNIRFLSLNVGLKNNLAGLLTLIGVHKLDLIFLQEVRLSESEIKQIVGLDFECKVNIDEENVSRPGTAVIWKISIPITNVTNLVPCRAQFVEIQNCGLVNVYAPSGSDRAQERAVFFSTDIFQALSLDTRLSWGLAGDFNCLLSPFDVENGTGYRQKTCPQLSDLVRVKKLSDTFRYMHPNKREFTFFRSNAAASRLDRIYLSEDILDRVSFIEHIASLSDHCGVFMGFDFSYSSRSNKDTGSPKSKIYWKLNTAILY